MQKILVNFAVVVLGVLVALFAYDKLRSSRTTGDFGAGEQQARKKMIQSDFVRAADPAKLSMSEFYASTVKWPTKNEEAGLPAPDSYRGDSLRKLEIAGATITMTFDARSGVDGGQVVVNGEPTPNLAMGIKWTCTSPNIKDIATILPGCTYQQQ